MLPPVLRLGDIAALLDPDIAKWEVVECPEVDWDLSHKFKKTKGSILRCGVVSTQINQHAQVDPGLPAFLHYGCPS